MSTINFPRALAFVWQSGFDSPADGYHVEPGDPGGGTKGGVIEATWGAAVRRGIVRGALRAASDADLSNVLRALTWSSVCDRLPGGIDLVCFNGFMMSGHYPWLLQRSLGFMGSDDVDGDVGDKTMAAVRDADPATLINALSGIHYDYLTHLTGWLRDGGGWTTRLKAARLAALALLAPQPAPKEPIA